MLTRGRIGLGAAAIVFAAWLAAPAYAAGWDPPEWRARLDGRWDSNLYPGYENTSADQAIAAEFLVATGVRPAPPLKLSFELAAGGIAYAHFDEANSGWLGAEASARHGATRLDLAVGWSPHLTKFPSDPVDATFERWKWGITVRRNVSRAVHLRLEGDFERDNYVPSFDERDDHETALALQTDWAVRTPLIARLELGSSWSRAASTNYSHDERHVQVGAVVSGAATSVETSLEYTIRRYEAAAASEPGAESEPNFGRRDRTLTLAVQVARRLLPSLSARLGLELEERVSSRQDRSYEKAQLRFGVEWVGGGG